MISFIVSKIEASPWAYVVHGHLVFIEIKSDKDGVRFNQHYLTPVDSPMRMEVPPWLFSEEDLGSMSTNKVTEAFTRLMTETDFSIVPPVPLDIPLHKIPPSKLAKVRRAKEKEARTPAGPKSPLA